MYVVDQLLITSFKSFSKVFKRTIHCSLHSEPLQNSRSCIYQRTKPTAIRTASSPTQRLEAVTWRAVSQSPDTTVCKNVRLVSVAHPDNMSSLPSKIWTISMNILAKTLVNHGRPKGGHGDISPFNFGYSLLKLLIVLLFNIETGMKLSRWPSQIFNN